MINMLGCTLLLNARRRVRKCSETRKVGERLRESLKLSFDQLYRDFKPYAWLIQTNIRASFRRSLNH